MSEEKVTINKKALESVVNLIDAVSSRGAFRGEELEGIGQFRNNLAKECGMFNAAAETNSQQNEETNQELITE